MFFVNNSNEAADRLLELSADSSTERDLWIRSIQVHKAAMLGSRCCCVGCTTLLRRVCSATCIARIVMWLFFPSAATRLLSCGQDRPLPPSPPPQIC